MESMYWTPGVLMYNVPTFLFWQPVLKTPTNNALYYCNKYRLLIFEVSGFEAGLTFLLRDYMRTFPMVRVGGTGGNSMSMLGFQPPSFTAPSPCSRDDSEWSVSFMPPDSDSDSDSEVRKNFRSSVADSDPVFLGHPDSKKMDRIRNTVLVGPIVTTSSGLYFRWEEIRSVIFRDWGGLDREIACVDAPPLENWCVIKGPSR